MNKLYKSDDLMIEKDFLISGVPGITASKKDEEYYRHLATIVESSDDAIISKSLDGTIKSWNKGCEKMFGYTEEEAVGKNVSLIIPPEYIELENKILERIRSNEIIDHYETVRNKKNGKQIYVSLTEFPLKDHAGNIIGVSKIARDITTRKKFEAELIEANKELAFQNEEKEKRADELTIANKELVFQNEEKEKRAAELIVANKELALQNEENKTQAAELESVTKELESFSYSVSHDLRAPLRAINCFTSILLEDYLEQLDDEAKEILEKIMSNSIKIGKLIDNLLGFSRIVKQHVSMVDVNIKELVNSVVAEQKHIEPTRKINLTVKKLENIRGDRNMLKQVFKNLVSNAFKYTGKKKEAVIEIGSYHEKDDCIYYVKDNGAGFDMQYADKLFGVFQRLHSSNQFEGTGVGLAIIQKIISKHGGKVWAEAKVDDGACFYISLPATQKNQ